MNENLARGAQIVVNDWIRVKKSDKVLIVTTKLHLYEAQAMEKYLRETTSLVDIMLVEKIGKQIGVYFDQEENIFDGYTAIIAATDYSLITTKATKRARNRGARFLSLPLLTNDGRSMLEYDFMTMDTKKSKMIADIVKEFLDEAVTIHIKTTLGTDLHFYKHGRTCGLFNGNTNDSNKFSSASLELYIPIEETKTHGKFIVDASLGYIGKVEKPFEIVIENGKIIYIEQTDCGKRLDEYIKSFNDPNMYVASELGIGLNSIAKANGNCYIEDESAYGTFHIGFGRNIALGGQFEASGHFDLVAHKPYIYADNRKIMEDGVFISPIPNIF